MSDQGKIEYTIDSVDPSQRTLIHLRLRFGTEGAVVLEASNSKEVLNILTLFPDGDVVLWNCESLGLNSRSEGK